MTTTAAQDEFNELLRDKDIDHRHPEDRDADSDHSEPDSADHDQDDYRELIDTDDELEIPLDMRSNYQVPTVRYEANTGPKGVIADAQAFQEAMKQELGSKAWNSKPTSWQDENTISDEENEEKFMRLWRERRVKELQNIKQRIRSRTISPGRRIYGTMPIVNAEQYLKATEQTPPTTVLVVMLCSSSYKIKESEYPSYRSQHERAELKKTLEERAARAEAVEAAMHEVARRNDTVRFIMLYDDHGVEPVGLPAINAYKAGHQFATVLPVDDLPEESDISPVSLETLLRQDKIL